MAKSLSFPLLIAAGLLSSTAHAAISFSELTPPNFQYGDASGISGGLIVGNYTDTNYNSIAYVFDGSSYGTISVPGSVNTMVFGISGINIVGRYVESVSYITKGFTFDGTNYTTLVVPGAYSTLAYGVSGTTVVGFYGDESYNYNGFIFDGTNYTTLSVPGAFNTRALGISGNYIVGSFQQDDSTKGFIFDGTNYTTLVVPGAYSTSANGISGNYIVGSYSDQTGSHGFVFDGSTYRTLDYPDVSLTVLQGISGDSVVGWYDDGSEASRAFVATSIFSNGPTVPEPSTYGLIGIGALGVAFAARRRKIKEFRGHVTRAQHARGQVGKLARGQGEMQ
jgi:hypothetical protein